MLKFKLAKPMLAGLAACTASVAFNGVVFADEAQEKALKEQMRIMQQQMQDLQRQMEGLNKQAPPPAAAPSAPAGAVGPSVAKAASTEPKFDKFISGFYGTLDVSMDYTTRGMSDFTAYHYGLIDPTNPNAGFFQNTAAGPKVGPQGRVGWMGDLSTNKSVVGYRGSHKISGTGLDLIYQLEVQPQITNAPGTSASYTQTSNVTKGSLGYGDSFVGLSNNSWGKFKIGTTYTPYKKSTDRMNPFSGMLGDYAVIMGNSGGDNRVEFGSRIDHSMWYESPKIANVFSFDLLFSPGQNRTTQDIQQAQGSGDCTGGNVPGSGNLLLNCDDGAFDSAFSVDLKFESGPIYITAAYELHRSVNRASDGIGANSPYYAYYAGLGNGVSPLLDWNQFNFVASEYPGFAANGSPGYVGDRGNESAAKIGIQYTFDFGLAISGIYEDLRRYLPAALEFQNERQRHGTWFAASYDISPKDNLSIGWAHAAATVGDPGGQHNYDPLTNANFANMYTIALKHRFDKNVYWYLDAADTVNGQNAHFDLGAGGRGITQDCHDGTTTPVNDYTSAGNTTWGGCHLIGFSTGVNYKF